MKQNLAVTPGSYTDKRQTFLGDYTPSKKMALDFSNAENPLGCSPQALDAIRSHLSGVHHYPSPVSADLKAAIDREYNLSSKNLHVTVTAGAGAGILLCVQALMRPGQNVVIPEATFPVAIFGATTGHGRGRMVKMGNDLSIDLSALAAAVGYDTALVFLSNPNNPTGEVIPVDTLIDFARSVSIPVVVSEANADYANITCLSRSVLPENLVIIRSFSKIHGLAGLRVGAVIAHERITRLLQNALCPFTVSSLAEAAAIAALTDKDHIDNSRDYMSKQRHLLHYTLTSIGLHTLPSSANTMMVRIPDHYAGATEFAQILTSRGCTVVDGSNFCPAASRYIRISPRTAGMNTDLINLLQQVAK